MPPDTRPGRPKSRRRVKLRIRSDWLLLVEGRDEFNLFGALMKHCFGAESRIQVIEAGGKDSFSENLLDCCKKCGNLLQLRHKPSA